MSGVTHNRVESTSSRWCCKWIYSSYFAK